MRSVYLLLLLATLAGCSSLAPSIPAPAKAKRDTALSMEPGNLSRIHPQEKPKPFVEELGNGVLQEVKDRTWLFFINGLDPYYLANFRGQCQYMKALGYHNAYCGQMGHLEVFRSKIKQVRKDDPTAQIAIVGYSLGANSARTLANQLKDDGVRIELLVYLGGDTIMNGDTSRPANVGRILNINGKGSILLGYGLFVQGDDIEGASNHRLASRHFLLPTRAESTELLVRHVVDLNQAERGDAGVVQASYQSLKR